VRNVLLFDQEPDVDRISITAAKARFGELLDRVEAGAAVVITRNGRPVATLSPVRTAPKPIDPDRLAALASNLPPQTPEAGDLIRSMRDSDRS
jgi:prevent-host-death family protein